MSDTPAANKRPASPSLENNTAKRAREESSSSSPKKDAAKPTVDKKKMDENVETGSTGDAGPSTGATISALPTSIPATPAKPAADSNPTAQQISMRALIVTQDASVIIGRAGAHVNEIREKSGARVTISESIPGNPERILNVFGALDAVSKAFGLIVRRINDEPFDVASVPGSRAVTIKFIIPNSRMGSVIGRGGSKIKEIQDASGARLNASEVMLPGSTERILSVSGVADAIHIAVYYIGTILLEYQERNPGPPGGAYRQQPGGYQPPTSGYSAPPHRGSVSSASGAPSGAPPADPGSQTQQIFIPNSLVGAIIGKAGVKINEIRAQSQCQIRVTEPGTAPGPGQVANPDERLVTITGQPSNINIAVQMLYHRLEAEKAKAAQGGM
ncbi:hypothetical protein CspeluHIS016_0406710 [Cutaneotrichosporon spelunceum]|uniref:K Homology domain-containing protein n=1 Tax=Cutaneotrichosporon spelunceum TaxID=1672016 RepID=A0AAD3TWS1_9TREE|nr:hypothetical protein CspeluHIS016_0406710 [Cutaneotrichosporon spelunceum]